MANELLIDPWVPRRPHLLRLEQHLTASTTRGRILRSGPTILLREAVEHDGRLFVFEAQFAPNHPFAPPRVYLLQPTDGPRTVEVHRFQDGELCLQGPDEWRPTNTVAVWTRNRVLSWIAHYSFYLRSGVWRDLTP